MKILASADWHIKLNQKNVPVDWAKARFRGMFEQVHALSEQADLHIVMGDVFDKLPSMEELELYFEFVAGVRVPTYIFDGNQSIPIGEDRVNKTLFAEIDNNYLYRILCQSIRLAL